MNCTKNGEPTQPSASVIAPLVNLSVHSVYKIVEGYNLKGVSFIHTKARGGRRRSLMTLEMEMKLMKGLEADALKGKIKSGDLVVLAAFGSGFTWGSAIIRW